MLSKMNIQKHGKTLKSHENIERLIENIERHIENIELSSGWQRKAFEAENNGSTLTPPNILHFPTNVNVCVSTI